MWTGPSGSFSHLQNFRPSSDDRSHLRHSAEMKVLNKAKKSPSKMTIEECVARWRSAELAKPDLLANVNVDDDKADKDLAHRMGALDLGAQECLSLDDVQKASRSHFSLWPTEQLLLKFGHVCQVSMYVAMLAEALAAEKSRALCHRALIVAINERQNDVVAYELDASGAADWLRDAGAAASRFDLRLPGGSGGKFVPKAVPLQPRTRPAPT